MPSFDVVSEVEMHEVTNAVDQANRELASRFDFKGIQASYKLEEDSIKLSAEADIQIRQMVEILQNKFAKRNIDLSCLQFDPATPSGKFILQTAKIKQGIETPLAKEIVKKIKDSKLKVQAAIQGEKIRVTGAKRDDLQSVMSLLRESNFEIPLQYNNFRD
jgi:uncharacterized protein YajQ (UPF0234 family)